MQDIISFLQNRAGSKREDLATEVLALLLREDAGQSSLRQLFPELILADDSPIEVVTRRATNGCVPDMLLLQNGTAFAILEMKFWASLTSHQFSGHYFTVAPSVLFVAPDERLEALEEELGHLSSSGHSLRFTSWRELLGRLEQAQEQEQSTSTDARLFTGALFHLKEFCQVTEQDHFVPFTTEQLQSPAEDGYTEHLVWLTREAIRQGLKTDLLDTSFFYGQNVVVAGMRVWLGYWPKAWKQWPKDGPLWIQIYGREATALRNTGAFRDAHHSPGNELAVPLLSTGRGSATTQEDEVLAIIAAVRNFSERIKLQLPKLAASVQLA